MIGYTYNLPLSVCCYCWQLHSRSSGSQGDTRRLFSLRGSLLSMFRSSAAVALLCIEWVNKDTMHATQTRVKEQRAKREMKDEKMKENGRAPRPRRACQLQLLWGQQKKSSGADRREGAAQWQSSVCAICSRARGKSLLVRE